jgi:general transcription factor IIIA
MVKHTGQYPHRCEKCGRGFVNLKSWRSHKQAHLPHKCPHCPKLFEHWSELVAHKKLEHANEFKCPDCSKVFHTRKNLKSHAKTHRTETDDELVYPCTYENCGRTYSQVRNLNAHIKSKHLKNQKFVCTHEGCSRELSSKQKLQMHLKLHSKNREIMRKPIARPGRRIRKDAGQSKTSCASQLSALEFDKEAEQALKRNEGSTLVIDPRLMMDSASESEIEIDRIVSQQLKEVDNELNNLCNF